MAKPHISSVGYQWLSEFYNIESVQPFRIKSRIASARHTECIDGFWNESYPANLRPLETLQGHITFALKREGIHLEFLSRLFDIVPIEEIEQWIASEPTGQYARRAGFLFEWLTDRKLSFSGVNIGNYIDVLDENLYITAVNPKNNTRWRVRDNLPGTRDYSPMIFRTEKVRHAEDYSISTKMYELETEYGEDLLMRSAVWLTIKESQASFAIEHEEKQVDRIKRFASVMERHCGQSKNPLDESTITGLQKEILGTGHKTVHNFGLRKSPVFVGESTSFTGQTVHYVAPHWNDISSMLAGLSAFS